MHCVLHPTLDYVNLSQMLLHCRDVTGQRIAELNGSSIVHKGLPHFKGKKKKDRIEVSDAVLCCRVIR